MSITAAKLQVEAGYADKGADRGLDRLDKKLKSSERGMRGLGDASHAVGGGLKVLGVAAIGASAALAGMFVGTIGPAAEFEKIMSGVKAVSGATGEEMKQLSALALQLGKDTVFSASEAASGLEELIKGGIGVQDIMGGAAAAALNLASAGAIPLTAAAEQMADAMNIFGLKGTDAAHAADLIAGAANASSMTVSDFGLALKQVGAVAKLSGQDIDSTAQAISVMAAAGIKGSDAGTSLKTMLLNLQPTTKNAIAQFRELGIVTADGSNLFVDATGKFKSMAEIAEILKEHTKDLTEAQKLQSLEIMFGTDAIRAAAIMSEAGAEGFAKMTAEMSKVTAMEVARERLNNLAGDMEQFKGSMETGAIMLGSLFTPALRGATKGLTDMLNAGIESLGGIQAHIDALVKDEGLSQWDAMLFVIADNLRQTFGDETATLFESFTNQVSAAGEMVKSFFKSSQEGGPGFVEAISGFMNAAGRAIDSFFENLGNIVIGVALAVRKIGDHFNQLGTMVREKLDGLGAILNDLFPGITAKAEALGAAIINGIKQGIINHFAGIQTFFNDRLNNLIEVGAKAIGAQSPSRKAMREIGIPIAEGVIVGVEQGLRANESVAVKALDGFMKELGSSSGTFAVDFGKVGGDLASNLALAIRDNTPAAGAAVGRALSRMVEDLGSAGVPEWRLLGEQLAGALHEAMATGTEESILAVHALIAENVGLINSAKEAAKAAKELEKAWQSGQGFFGAVTEVARDDSWVKQFGEAGASAVSAFTAAWDGDHNAEAKAANAIQKMIRDARKVGITDANEMGGQIIDTLGMALANGDEGLRDIGLAALAAYGQRIELAKLQTEEMKDAIKKMVDDGLSDMKRLQDAEGGKIDVGRDKAKIDRDLARRQAEIRSKGGPNMGAELAAAAAQAATAKSELDIRAREQEQDRARKARNEAALAAESARLKGTASARNGGAQLPPGASVSLGSVGAAQPLAPLDDSQRAAGDWAMQLFQERPIELQVFLDGQELDTVIKHRSADRNRTRAAV